MASGIWTAVSGATAKTHAIDTVANNLANADTLGFKKDEPAFKEYLANVEKNEAPLPAAPGPITNRELYPLHGQDLAYVAVTGSYTNFKPGHLKVTNQPLDVSIEGNGFFEIATPQGIRYTRNGAFKMGSDGRLVTSEGYPVLSAGSLAQPEPGQTGGRTLASIEAELSQAAGRYINLRDQGGSISITSQGEVFMGESPIAKLSVVEFGDIRKLKKVGNQFFDSWDPANRLEGAKSMVRQGVLETSNVNPIEEMTNLINAHRGFEHDMKSVKTYGDLMQREANDIGKL